MINQYVQLLAAHPDREAVIWRDTVRSYGQLAARVAHWREWCAQHPARVTAVVGDFSPEAIACCLGAWQAGRVVVPGMPRSGSQHDALLAIAHAEQRVTFNAQDECVVDVLPYRGEHPHYRQLQERGHPGLVVFTSGSSGTPKGAVHDVVDLLEKFRTPRRCLRTVAFLLFDHLGGWNTLWYILANGGTALIPQGRTPHAVLATVAQHRAELLPATPTFLNLVLLGEADRRHDCSSLKIISYGTEPMPESTLRQCRARFPHVALQQTYGLSELGVTRSKSRDSDSLWVQVGGEGFKTRVVDGVLQIQSSSMMLGYLNAPSPLTTDGWFHTGDLVAQDGEYVRFLGRESDVINVGGEKVFPAEVEAVIQELPAVAEVTVFGERNPIIGNMVCCRVRPRGSADGLPEQIRAHCHAHLPRYKVPVKVTLVHDEQHTERFKKRRVPQVPDSTPPDTGSSSETGHPVFSWR